MYPDAKIPVVALSLKAGLDSSAHLAIGEALAPLREEGVLILGSGMSYHNLRKFGSGKDIGALSAKFDDWLKKTCESAESKRNKELARWSFAPHARDCHPREEHLIPLMVTAGAAGTDLGKIVFNDDVFGAKVMGVQFGDSATIPSAEL